MSSFLKKLNNSIPVKATSYPLPVVRNSTALRVPNVFDSQLRMVGNDIVLYPQDNGQRYIDQGYKKNDGVYSICTKNAKKAGQLRLYPIKVKRNERKTANEYRVLQKGAISPLVLKELARMKKSMVEDYVVDSPLAKLLNKPNRNQTQSQWIENLFLNWDLQGEGNILFTRFDGKGVPLEMFVIPKQHINLVGTGRDFFEIVSYQLVVNALNLPIDKNDFLMWKHENPTPLSYTLEHLRGMAPLEAFIVGVQAMNEGDVRVATSNKNGGANGFAFRTDVPSGWEPSLEAKQWARQQFDSLINNAEMINRTGFFGGTWGYHNLGQSIRDQQIIEQYNIAFDRLCRVFLTPHGIFNDDAKFANGPQYKKDWICDKIATSVYEFKSLLNDKLLPEFGLDPETNMIDCDVNSLPEMQEDMKAQADVINSVAGLSVDQRLEYLGFPAIGGAMGEARLVPSTYQTLKELTSPIGGSLDQDINDLNL